MADGIHTDWQGRNRESFLPYVPQGTAESFESQGELCPK